MPANRGAPVPGHWAPRLTEILSSPQDAAERFHDRPRTYETDRRTSAVELTIPRVVHGIAIADTIGQLVVARFRMEGEPMKNDEAWRWLTVGLALLLAGLQLFRIDDAFLVPLWGTGLVLVGSVLALVGTGVLLRLWR